MERYLLFIRDKGSADVADIHPDESSARRALVHYVRRHQVDAEGSAPISDDLAIATYFNAEGTLYAIGSVSPVI